MSRLNKTKKVIRAKNIVVKIDKTKLGKRRYNRGDRLKGVQSICGIKHIGVKQNLLKVENRKRYNL